jgi:hypothetical protein
MTPYEITMLLEIYCGSDDPSATPSPLKDETLAKFARFGLTQKASNCARGYQATERAKVYIDALCSTPWPVQRWVMPTEDDESN